ncbi:MAG: hypothetical protein WBA67_03055, partial [Jannaschia sp.]
AVNELQRRAVGLRDAGTVEATTIAELIVQDRHDAWRHAELSKLTLQLAKANAVAQPLREAHARDVARQQVVSKLSKRR